MMDDEHLLLEKIISDYIDNQRCVLWGQYFDINTKEGNKQSKEFILDLLIDLGFTFSVVDESKKKKKRKSK